MADINQVISLGIGTPADIKHFILFGLNPYGVATNVMVGLHERLFGVGTLEARGFAGSLYERLFGSATLDDRDIATGLHERKFGSGSLRNKP